MEDNCKAIWQKKTNENSCSETIKIMVQFIMTCFNNHWFLGNCLYTVVKLVNRFDRNDIILTELARYGVLQISIIYSGTDPSIWFYLN